MVNLKSTNQTYSRNTATRRTPLRAPLRMVPHTPIRNRVRFAIAQPVRNVRQVANDAAANASLALDKAKSALQVAEANVKTAMEKNTRAKLTTSIKKTQQKLSTMKTTLLQHANRKPVNPNTLLQTQNNKIAIDAHNKYETVKLDIKDKIKEAGDKLKTLQSKFQQGGKSHRRKTKTRRSRRGRRSSRKTKTRRSRRGRRSSRKTKTRRSRSRRN